MSVLNLVQHIICSNNLPSNKGNTRHLMVCQIEDKGCVMNNKSMSETNPNTFFSRGKKLVHN